MRVKAHTMTKEEKAELARLVSMGICFYTGIHVFGAFYRKGAIVKEDGTEGPLVGFIFNTLLYRSPTAYLGALAAERVKGSL